MITYCSVSFLMYVHFDPQGDRVSWEQCLSLCILQCLARVGYPAGLSPVQSRALLSKIRILLVVFGTNVRRFFF